MSPANDGSGVDVPAPDGYTTSTDSMSSSARAITTAAEDAQSDTEDLQPTQLSEDEFGTAHTDHFADYAAAIEEFGAGAQAMCDNLIAFAGQLGGAGQAYAATDQDATQTVNTSGAGL